MASNGETRYGGKEKALASLATIATMFGAAACSSGETTSSPATSPVAVETSYAAGRSSDHVTTSPSPDRPSPTPTPSSTHREVSPRTQSPSPSATETISSAEEMQPPSAAEVASQIEASGNRAWMLYGGVLVEGNEAYVNPYAVVHNYETGEDSVGCSGVSPKKTVAEVEQLIVFDENGVPQTVDDWSAAYWNNGEKIAISKPQVVCVKFDADPTKDPGSLGRDHYLYVTTPDGEQVSIPDGGSFKDSESEDRERFDTGYRTSDDDDPRKVKIGAKVTLDSNKPSKEDIQRAARAYY